MHQRSGRLDRADRAMPGVRWSVLLLLSLLVAGTGCQGGYRWEMVNFQGAEKRAREQGKVLFIFYQFWLDTRESGRMKGYEVLSDPEVEAEFQNTVNVLIDRDSGPSYTSYVRKYGVSTYPASILLTPDGNKHVRTGFVPKQEFLEWVRGVKARAGKPVKNGAESPPSPKQASP